MEEWIVDVYDEYGSVYVSSTAGECICSVYGNTFGEEIDIASRIAKLPSLEKERDELLKWKNETLQVDREWDEQKVGRILNMQLGDSIRKNIEPKIQELIAERNKWKEMFDLQTKIVVDLEMRLMNSKK